MKRQIVFLFVLLGQALLAQSTFEKIYSRTANDATEGIIHTSDNGFLVWGTGSGEEQVMKLDSLGNVLWAKDYEYDLTRCVETPDGGFIFGTNSGRCLKINAGGTVIWFEHYVSGFLVLKTVRPTLDGNYIFTGINHESGSIALLKIGPDGGFKWYSQVAKPPSDDIGYDVVQALPDSSYMVLAQGRYSPTATVAVLVKFDKNGVFQWDEMLLPSTGASGGPVQIMQLMPGQVKVITHDSFTRTRIIDLDLNGTVLGLHQVDMNMPNNSNQVFSPTNDGGFVLIGDYYKLVKLDASYNVVWTKEFGGPLNEFVKTVVALPDGTILMGGNTKNFTTSYTSHYLIKTDSLGLAVCHDSVKSESTSIGSISTPVYGAGPVATPTATWSPPFPVANTITMTAYDACTCTPPSFDSYGNPYWAETWFWDFGDGTTSTEIQPDHNFPADGTYYVCCTITNSCGTAVYCDSVNYVFVPVGIQENQAQEISIHPNPSTGEFFISGSEKGNMEIFNLTGKKIYSGVIPADRKVVMSTETKGVYFIRFVTEGCSNTMKLFIQ